MPDTKSVNIVCNGMDSSPKDDSPFPMPVRATPANQQIALNFLATKKKPGLGMASRKLDFGARLIDILRQWPDGADGEGDLVVMCTTAFTLTDEQMKEVGARPDGHPRIHAVVVVPVERLGSLVAQRKGGAVKLSGGLGETKIIPWDVNTIPPEIKSQKAK